MIELWNSTVTKNDLVYVLGDFSFYNGEKTNEILKQLKGKKILIVGNHDYKFLQDKKFDKNLFEEITMYKVIKKKKTVICMCHYPLAEWDKKHCGSIHLYGHIHTIDNDAQRYMITQKNCWNVGIDTCGKLININDFIERNQK